MAPSNVALAINYQCSACETLAAAYQFVFGSGQEVELTNDGKHQLDDIRKRFHDLKQRSDLTLQQIADQIAALAGEVAHVLETQLVPVAPKGADASTTTSSAPARRPPDRRPRPAPPPPRRPLALDRWVKHPVMADGGVVGGVATDRINGTLDPVRAINDLLSVAAGFGASDPGTPGAIPGKDAGGVRRAVRSTSVAVVTGRKDRLLRHLSMAIDFAVSEQDRLRAALGNLAGVRLTMTLDVADPNKPVSVPAPAHPRPASELPGPG